jgi:hypothetical protein
MGTTVRLKSYLLELRVPTPDANKVCDDLIALYPGDVEASGVGKNRAFIRFRATDDEAALAVAAGMKLEGETYMITTGYGMHRRIVRDYSAS